MRAVHLPSWREILAEGGPWARLLRSQSPGLWLLRMTAEDVPGLVVRFVDGARCAESDQLFEEWAAALGLADDVERTWEAFVAGGAGLPTLRGSAVGVLVSDAERLLVDEPSSLPILLDALRTAVTRADRTVRVVFQARASDEVRLSVFREFDVGELP